MIDTTELEASLRQGAPVHEETDDLLLDIDRPLPFLVVHRVARAGDVTERLVVGQSSFLIAGPQVPEDAVRETVRHAARVLADTFGAFLVVDIWQGEAAGFTVAAASGEEQPPREVQAFCAHLSEIESHGLAGGARFDTEGPLSPPGLEPLLSEAELAELGAVLLGVQVPAVLVSKETGAGFPELMREIRQDLFSALQQLFFSFAQTQTTYEVDDFRALGRRALQPIGWDVDRQLASIALQTDFLLNVTPVNSETAWAAFRDGGGTEEPRFHYRPLTEDPDLLKRKLYALEIDEVHDPTLVYLLRAKRAELDRQITMLEDRDTPRFLHESIQLYGPLEERTVAVAEEILETVPEPPEPPDLVRAPEFARLAVREIRRYADQHPELDATVILRDDVPGLVTYRGNLIVGSNTEIPRDRVEPLLHHEVGTHILTTVNGRCQPLRILMVGLPGYEETQEGLAVFSEYMVGGLGFARLRLLAGRVVAVKRLIEGASFPDVFQELTGKHNFSPRTAWKITMRVYRSGGLTKDAIYLAGLIKLLDHLAAGGPLEPLFTAKVTLDQIPLIEELTFRQILVPPVLSPRWLEHDQAPRRLAKARSVRDLIQLALEEVEPVGAER